MGSMIAVRAADDTSLPVYLAEPTGIRRGSLVVIQEIFGVNPYIRSVADQFAEAGYVCYAPDLYHRIEPGIELGYEAADVQRGLELKSQTGLDLPVMDVQTCVATLLIDHRVWRDTDTTAIDQRIVHVAAVVDDAVVPLQRRAG